MFTTFHPRIVQGAAAGFSTAVSRSIVPLAFATSANGLSSIMGSPSVPP